jgi:hypothetical protein
MSFLLWAIVIIIFVTPIVVTLLFDDNEGLW